MGVLLAGSGLQVNDTSSLRHAKAALQPTQKDERSAIVISQWWTALTDCKGSWDVLDVVLLGQLGGVAAAAHHVVQQLLGCTSPPLPVSLVLQGLY